MENSAPESGNIRTGVLVVIGVAVLLVAFLIGKGSGDDSGPSTTQLPSTSTSINPSIQGGINTGIELYRAGNLDGALAEYQKVLKIEPTNKFALFNIGLVYYDKGDMDQAMNYYTAAIVADPTFASARYNRGLLYKDQKQDQKAIADLEAVIEVEPDSSRALINLGRLLVASGDAKRGNELIQKAISIDPALKP